MSEAASRRGRRLLLLAPYGAQVWAGILPALEAACEVFVVDPGDEADLVQMARRVLRDAPPRFHVAGLCLGGHVALEIYSQAPERVSGLALINTGLAPDSSAQRRIREERIAKLSAKAFEMSLPDDAYVDHAAQWLVSPHACGSQPIMSQVRNLLAQTPVLRSLAQQQAMLGRPDNRRYLTAKAAPVLVVGADGDRVCPWPGAEEVSRHAPHAQLRILHDCGHLSPVEKPLELAALLTDWLSIEADLDVSHLSRPLEKTA